jgi:hypothetical protein
MTFDPPTISASPNGLMILAIGWMQARVTQVAGLGEVLEVLGEAAISAEPRESAFDHPSTG